MAEIESLFSKQVINDAIALGKHLQDVDKYINTLKNSNVSAAAAQKSYTDAQKMVADGAKQLAAEQMAATKELAAKTKEEEKATKLAKDMAAAIALEVKSISDAEKQNKALLQAKKQLNLATEEGRKKNEQYNQTINKNTEFIRKNSDAMTQQRMNVGNYSASIQDALSKMGPFGAMISSGADKMKAFTQSMKSTKAGTDVASTGVSGLGKAFIASGIGAIIVAIVFAATGYSTTTVSELAPDSPATATWPARGRPRAWMRHPTTRRRIPACSDRAG